MPFSVLHCRSLALMASLQLRQWVDFLFSGSYHHGGTCKHTAVGEHGREVEVWKQGHLGGRRAICPRWLHLVWGTTGAPLGPSWARLRSVCNIEFRGGCNG